MSKIVKEFEIVEDGVTLIVTEFEDGEIIMTEKDI
tara:strand:+ start:34 stop:138 length:105 start_codon:yes stop_codon:yes gene_type:complete